MTRVKVFSFNVFFLIFGLWLNSFVVWGENRLRDTTGRCLLVFRYSFGSVFTEFSVSMTLFNLEKIGDNVPAVFLWLIHIRRLPVFTYMLCIIYYQCWNVTAYIMRHMYSTWVFPFSATLILVNKKKPHIFLLRLLHVLPIK